MISRRPIIPYESPTKKKSRKYGRINILGLLVIIGLGGAAWNLVTFTRLIDFCDWTEGKGTVRETLVILDASDPWSQLREQQIKDD